jgi:hypothetical protein
MARGIASRAFCLLGFATRRTPRTAAAPARDTMEPAAKKARGGGGDDDAARLAPQQSKTARTVDNADLKAWQYNVIAWKSCEDFAERLHASDPERFQYRETVWEKFDDSKMDHIIVGGFTPKNVMARCRPRSQPASQPARSHTAGMLLLLAAQVARAVPRRLRRQRCHHVSAPRVDHALRVLHQVAHHLHPVLSCGAPALPACAACLACQRRPGCAAA